MNAYLRAVHASFNAQWRVFLTPLDLLYPLLAALGPAIGVGYVVGSSGNEVAIGYVFVGAALMALWTLGVFNTGWTMATEHMDGTLDLLMTTRTPLVLVIFGKVLATMAYLAPSAAVSFLVVLAFSQRVTPVADPLLLLMSGLLAVTSVIAFSFIFAPIGFLMGARGMFQALMPLGVAVSGFLYPIDVLPGALELMAMALPSSWAMDSVVRSVNGNVSGVAIDCVMALGLILFYAGVSALLFRVAERRVRITGNLGRI